MVDIIHEKNGEQENGNEEEGEETDVGSSAVAVSARETGKAITYDRFVVGVVVVVVEVVVSRFVLTVTVVAAAAIAADSSICPAANAAASCLAMNKGVAEWYRFCPFRMLLAVLVPSVSDIFARVKHGRILNIIVVGVVAPIAPRTGIVSIVIIDWS